MASPLLSRQPIWIYFSIPLAHIEGVTYVMTKDALAKLVLFGLGILILHLS